MDRSQNGLVPVTVKEEAGLIFAAVGPAACSDAADGFLGPIAEQFHGLGTPQLVATNHEMIVTPTNWKLALETFAESYHVPALHPQLASLIVGSGLAFDSFGAHGRITLPLVGIRQLYGAVIVVDGGLTAGYTLA